MTPLKAGDHDTLPESLSDALKEALDGALHGGPEAASHGAAGDAPTRVRCAGRSSRGERAEAEVEVRALGPIGAEVERVRVRRTGGRDVQESASALPHRIDRLLPEPLVPIEVDRRLGRASLRTPAERMKGRRYFDLGLTSEGEADLQRLRVDDDGERHPEPFTLTREQLRALVDALA